MLDRMQDTGRGGRACRSRYHNPDPPEIIPSEENRQDFAAQLVLSHCIPLVRRISELAPRALRGCGIKETPAVNRTRGWQVCHHRRHAGSEGVARAGARMFADVDAKPDRRSTLSARCRRLQSGWA